MSFENVEGAITLLDNQVLPFAGEPAAQGGDGPNLSDALALLSAGHAEGSAILRADDDASGIDDGILRDYTFDPNMPSDDGGGGHIDVYEPAIYAPEGFVADDLYEVEFILDPTTGVLTINLHFSTDPLDHQASAFALSDTGLTTTGGFLVGSTLGDLAPDQTGPRGGSKCTITITKTTTETSSSSSFSFKAGVVNYTSNSGGTSVSTTKTVSIEGELINGRCVARNGR